MRIAVISDVHVGVEAKSQDLCPKALVKRGARAQFEAKPKNYVDEFIAFVKKEKLSADYLLVPGDVTDTGCPIAVKMASEFLERVRAALHVKKPHVLFVPGNHDVDWDMFDSKDDDAIKWSHRYIAFESDKYIFSSINKRGRGNLLKDSFYKIWNYKDLIVLGYNSSSTDTPSCKTHAGEIVVSHIKAIDKQLGRYKVDGKLRVCLLHHHLKKYSSPHETERDFSAADNAVDFLKVLEEHRFDLIVHGHRHHSFLDANSDGVPILCAGSFSAQVTTAWEGVATNQFHLIDIDKSGKRNRAHGIIRSWSNTINGWVESEEKRGSHAVGYSRGFGISLKDQTVATKVCNVCETFVRRGRTFWWKRNVVKKMPKLRYLIESQDEIISWCTKNLIDARKWEVFTNKEDNDIVLMRKEGGRRS